MKGRDTKILYTLATKVEEYMPRWRALESFFETHINIKSSKDSDVN
jgi:hypothetical protein